MSGFWHKFSYLGNIFMSLSLLYSLFIVINQQNRINIMEMKSTSTIYSRFKRSNTREGAIEYSVETPPNPFEPIGIKERQNFIPTGVGEQLLYFPLYTQISNATLEKMCRDRFEYFSTPTIQGTIDLQKANKNKEQKQIKLNSKSADQNNKKKWKLSMLSHKKFPLKYCAAIKSLGPAQLIGQRLYKNGSAIRHSFNQWFLTEYQTGYTLFQFEPQDFGTATADKNDIEEREVGQNNDEFLGYPSKIHSLPEPFRGTDHTISDSGSGLVFFYEVANGNKIQAYNLHSKQRVTRLMLKSNNALYRTSSAESDDVLNSSIDFERDHIALWAIYREQHNSSFLTELKRWELHSAIIPSGMVNAFVSCGVLYTVHNQPPRELYEQNVNAITAPPSLTLFVVAVYDFRISTVVEKEERFVGELPTLGLGQVSNIQFDLESDSLTYFDNGKVFSVPLHRAK